MHYRFRSLIRYTSLLLLVIIIHHGSRAASVSEFRHCYSYTLLGSSASTTDITTFFPGLSKELTSTEITYSKESKIKLERKRRKIIESSSELVTARQSTTLFPPTTLVCPAGSFDFPNTFLGKDSVRGPPAHS